MTIRAARTADIPAIQGIELAAGEAFRSIGLADVADDDPPSAAELTAHIRNGGALVAVDGTDTPVAYLLVEALGGRAHIEQVSVHPSHARRGLGARLIEVADAWADAHGLAGLTLTTFADVPWNAPYYARLGFAVLPDDAVDAALRERVREEEAHGLGLAEWPRVVMARGASAP